MALSEALSREYEELFASCTLRAERVASIDVVADRAVANQSRYEAVANKLGTPWYVVAAIHSLEASQRFNGHLHNGDPLTARTVQFPPGRPSPGTTSLHLGGERRGRPQGPPLP
jgi:lysozyme family protein